MFRGSLFGNLASRRLRREGHARKADPRTRGRGVGHTGRAEVEEPERGLCGAALVARLRDLPQQESDD